MLFDCGFGYVWLFLGIDKYIGRKNKMEEDKEKTIKLQNRFNEIIAWNAYLGIPPDGAFLQRVWNMVMYEDKPMHTQILIKDQMAEYRERLYEKTNQ
jgi:hypothetical protein